MSKKIITTEDAGGTPPLTPCSMPAFGGSDCRQGRPMPIEYLSQELFEKTFMINYEGRRTI